jgi:hypothetical protein
VRVFFERGVILAGLARTHFSLWIFGGESVCTADLPEMRPLLKKTHTGLTLYGRFDLPDLPDLPAGKRERPAATLKSFSANFLKIYFSG